MAKKAKKQKTEKPLDTVKKPRVKKRKVIVPTVDMPEGKNGVGEKTDEHLNELQLLRFSKGDAEVRAALQRVTDIDQKMQIEKLQFQHDQFERQRKFELEIARLKSERQTAVQFAETKIQQNNIVVKEISDKYGIPPESLAIDTDSGAVKDLR